MNSNPTFNTISNHGFLGGLGHEQNVPLLWAVLGLAGLMILFMALSRQPRSRGPAHFGFLLISAGFFSNFWERIAYGEVRDGYFVALPALHRLAAFNTADLLLFAGASVLLFTSTRKRFE